MMSTGKLGCRLQLTVLRVTGLPPLPAEAYLTLTAGSSCQHTLHHPMNATDHWDEVIFFPLVCREKEVLKMSLISDQIVHGESQTPLVYVTEDVQRVALRGLLEGVSVAIQGRFIDASEEDIDCMTPTSGTHTPLIAPVEVDPPSLASYISTRLLEKGFQNMMDSTLPLLAQWEAQPPTTTDVHAFREAFLKSQAEFAGQLKKFHEVFDKAPEREQELKTQVSNLWQNNASLERVAHNLRTELDFLQRKARSLEHACEKQSGQGKAGLTGNPLLDLEAEPLISEEASARRLIADEGQEEYLRATAEAMHSLVKTLGQGPAGSIIDRFPTAMSTSFSHSRSYTSDTVFSARQEQSQRLADTLSALRLRIEGALEACSMDTLPQSFRKTQAT